MQLLNIFLILCLITLSVSCKKNDADKSNEAKLLKVTCVFGDGKIDTITDKVTIKIPESADISQLIPFFEISKNATIYPPSGVALDFSHPVTFTITSEDLITKYVFTVTVLKPVARFTVYDCSSWSPVSFRVLQSNATIKIFTSASDVGTIKTYDILTSDLNAEAILYGVKSNNYYFTVEIGNKSNIVNGYVVIGTYNNQADVDGSSDPEAKIGGLWFMDFNGDGELNSLDKSNFAYISGIYDLDDENIFLKDLYIANIN